MGETRTVEQASIETVRTGPLGRLLRAGWLAVMVWGLHTLLTVFSDPGAEATPISGGFWLITAASVFILSQSDPVIGEGRARRLLGVVGVMTIVVGIAGALAQGELWSDPLARIVWSFDLVAYASVGLGFALAVILGTPGCEYGAYRDLTDRVRGRNDLPISHSCAAGLHVVDAWEARRRAAATKAEAKNL